MLSSGWRVVVLVMAMVALVACGKKESGQAVDHFLRVERGHDAFEGGKIDLDGQDASLRRCNAGLSNEEVRREAGVDSRARNGFEAERRV